MSGARRGQKEIKYIVYRIKMNSSHTLVFVHFICARVLVMSEVFWNGWFSNLAYCLFFSITVFLFSTTPCTSTNPRHPIGEYFSSYQMASLVPKTVAASLKLGFIFLLWICLIDFTECILFHNFKSYQQTAQELFLHYRRITIRLNFYLNF